VTPAILVSAFIAGATYTLIPGPAFLALLGIGAASGRRAGAGFVIEPGPASVVLPPPPWRGRSD
jgi:threonine/homoserine/homoserine lactone efflux protein